MADRWAEKETHRPEGGRRRFGFGRLLNPFAWITMLVRLLRAALFALVPQFESPSLDNVAGRRSSPTAYLDGLRGVAAFIVLIHHFSKDPFPWLLWGWGSTRNDTPQYHFLQLPIVRIVHSGPPMVAVFFVISGFALSYTPLKHIRNQNAGSLGSAMASSIFRRGMRLYLPCVVTTLFMVLAMQLGYAPFPTHRVPESNIFAELRKWLASMWWLLNPFDLTFTLPRYDDNLWTIPTELRGSMVLFMTILGVARLKYRARLAIESTVTVWLYSYGMWDIGLFTAGLLLAELHLERESLETNPLPTPPAIPQRFSKPRRRWLLPFIFVLALHLSSAPLLGYDTSWGYGVFHLVTPFTWADRGVSDRWIATIGAPLLVYCADRSSKFRRVLNSPVGRYLGRISFGLYLVHGPIRYTVYHPLLEGVMKGWGLKVVPVGAEAQKKGGWLKAIAWMPSVADHYAQSAREKAEKAQVHKEELEAMDWRFLAAVMMTWAILLPVTLGIADWFSRTIDRGSVRLAKSIEEKWVQNGFAQDDRVDDVAAKRRDASFERRRDADASWQRRQKDTPKPLQV